MVTSLGSNDFGRHHGQGARTLQPSGADGEGGGANAIHHRRAARVRAHEQAHGRDQTVLKGVRTWLEGK